jgi:hypothetical protein
LTDPLKELLRQYGMLAMSLAQLERERPGSPHASLQAYYDSLGTPATGEPVVVVRISADGATRFRPPAQHDREAAKYAAAGAEVTVWEFPEEEYYFFEAFRPALFDLEKLVNRELYQLMHEPIGSIFDKLRSQLGFRALTRQYDEAVSRLSLIRNCLMHNAAKVSSQLAAADKTLVAGGELHIDSNVVSDAIGVFRKLAVAIDRELEAL